MKACGKCGEVKPAAEFYKNKSKSDGLQANCKPCQREAVADYKQRSADKVRAANRDYSAERRKARTPDEMEAHRAYRRDYFARKRVENPDWYRDMWQRSTGARRALKSNAEHAPYSRSEIFAAYGGTCVYCGAPAEHLDHVVAISKGGADAAHNLLPACAPCNLSKSDKSLAEWALTWLTAGR